MPWYLEDVQNLQEHGRVAHGFTAVGYVVYLLPWYILAGITGIAVGQAVIYVATVLLVFRLLDVVVPVSRKLLIAVTLLIAIHPYLLLDVHRVNDNSLGIVFAVALMFWVLADQAQLSKISRAVLYGTVVGLYTSVRPNAVLFLLLPAVAAGVYGLREGWKTFAGRYAIFIAAAIVIDLAVGFVGTSRFPFWPSYGPYTLFLGNNPYSERALLEKYNAEPSVKLGLAYYHAMPTGGDANSTEFPRPEHKIDPALYLKLSLRFMSENPGETVRLWGIKAWTMFRPDLRDAGGPLKTIVQTFLALPVVLWLVCATWYIYAFGIRDLLLPFVYLGLFVFPFLLTNSDPRFRLPVLDVLLLLHAFVMVSKKWTRRGGSSPVAIQEAPAAAR